MDPDTVASGSPGSVHARANGASLIQVESSRLLPWLMISFGVACLSIAFSVFCLIQLSKAEREFRLVQIQVQDQSAIMIREGLKQPGDLANGPGGNVDYHRRK